jgi:hypothetical protein
MIKGGRNTESAVDARIVFYGHAGNSVRFKKGDELMAPDIEKNVSKVPAFFDLYRVGDDRLEAQNVLIELTGFVQV